ncbi:MAG: hypothetical protein EOP22_05600 [Hyphomicrobiales bacterium]|nr:MAG: hypothetical protein EOP22_05600 [Hyphomicrobiales bacterium]
MSRDPHIPAEKPFTPFPISHPILPPGSSPADPGRDTPLPDQFDEGNGVHPHSGNRPPAEEKDRGERRRR